MVAGIKIFCSDNITPSCVIHSEYVHIYYAAKSFSLVSFNIEWPGKINNKDQ